jgi:hypothetical protein
MCSVVNRKMSAADTKSELETDTEKRRADRSHEDEKKKRAHSPAMSAYMLTLSYTPRVCTDPHHFKAFYLPLA